MSEKAGVSYRQYQSLESGRSNPTLSTISRVAECLEVTLRSLLTLDQIKIQVSSDEFKLIFQRTFDNAKLGAGIRTLDGVVLYGNKYVAKLQGRDFKKPVNLFEILPVKARGLLRAQLSTEQRGLAQPYINFVKDAHGEDTYLRYYPTVVYPILGSRPLFTCAYITEIEKDSEGQYFKYCNLLLKASGLRS